MKEIAMIPDARKDGLLVQEVGDETIIYDQQRNHAHRLNRTAAFVWRACNGQRSPADLAQLLRAETGIADGEDMVLLALERLSKGHLLAEPFTLPDESRRVTRRDVLRKAALVGGISLMIPLVQSMVAPTPAMAMSVGCSKRGQPYSITHPCCPGLQNVGGICLGHA